MAFPARVVREVMPRPALVSVPRLSKVLAGICHIRGEVLPVLTLEGLAPGAGAAESPVLLVIDDGDDHWGVLTDEVSAIAALETSDAPDDDPRGWNSCVVGWAAYDKGVVQILDHARFRALAEDELSFGWSVSRQAGAGECVSVPQAVSPVGAA
jgi:chemotaxis signal transduction protein